MKQGLEKCRCSREASLDCLEDLKAFPPEADAEECCERLQVLVQDITHSVETLQEAMAKYSTGAGLCVKDEAPEPLAESAPSEPGSVA